MCMCTDVIAIVYKQQLAKFVAEIAFSHKCKCVPDITNYTRVVHYIRLLQQILLLQCIPAPHAPALLPLPILVPQHVLSISDR